MPAPAPRTETARTDDDPRGCGCVRRMNDALRETYPGVKVLTNVFTGQAAVTTYRATGKGKKTPTLFATYCPFCGMKYGG